MILQGRNAMPAFRQFRPGEVSALAAFLRTPPADAARPLPASAHRYTIDGYPLFLDPHGVPAIALPVMVPIMSEKLPLYRIPTWVQTRPS